RSSGSRDRTRACGPTCGSSSLTSGKRRRTGSRALRDFCAALCASPSVLRQRENRGHSGGGLGGLTRRALDCVCKIIRSLRTRHRKDIGENEERDAVHAGLLSRFGGLLHRRNVSVAGEEAANLIGIEPTIRGSLNQHLAIGKVAAFGEIDFHQALL